MKVESPYKVGVGILSMQERVKLIGGQFDISRTSRGTTVAVRLPYNLSNNGTCTALSHAIVSAPNVKSSRGTRRFISTSHRQRKFESCSTWLSA
jgi:hypothetical protein